jgi:hypothetical protein
MMQGVLVLVLLLIVVQAATSFRRIPIGVQRGCLRAQMTMAMEESTFREYPFEDRGLPLLPDVNNYYSGQTADGEMFWHQNSDNVFVFIPLEDDTKKSQIEVDFQALHVKVKLPGKDTIELTCLERLIPDGSFWIIEEDKQGKRYLHLDLEKRFRMINWKSLFGEPVTEDSADDIEKRSQMLEKLFAANKGMAKMTGQEPESMEEMMGNEDLVRMMADQIYGPEVVGVEDGEGNRLDEILSEIDFDVNAFGGVSLDDDDDEDVDGEGELADGVIDVEAV